MLNLISGVLRPDAGTIRLMGRDIAGLAAYRIARLGLARTFQLVRVLDGMDCRENIMAGLAFQKPHLPATEAEVRIDTLLDRVGLAGTTGGRRPTSPISTRSGWSSPARSPPSRACCCSTNGSPASIRPNW